MASAPESESALDVTLARIFWVMERMRLLGVAVLATLFVIFLVHDDALWKTLVAGLAAGILLVIGVRGLHRARHVYGAGETLGLLGSILGAQLVVITLTGGVRSPLLLVTPPIMLGLSVVTANARWRRPAFLTVLGLIAVLGLGDLLELWPPGALVPPALARDDGASSLGYVALATSGFVMVALLAGWVGLYLRRTLQAAIDTAVAARAETLEVTRARHRELEALSGALAHELKNPLASIKGLAVLLARKLPEQSQEAERMGVLLGEVTRMGQILDEFLNFSRPAEGLATSEVAAETLVGEVRALHEGEVMQRELRLKTEVQTRASIVADPRKLKQVLINLVQNALEATASGGVVIVRASETPSDVVFEIIDEGPGLAPAIHGRLFTVGATTKAAGTGLGLVIARGIAEQHGGTLTLEQRADRGGCVARLVVPRAGPVARSMEP